MNNNIYIGCTKKLIDQIQVDQLYNYNPHLNLHLWHANFKFLNRKKAILFTHDKSLFSFLLVGIKKADYKHIDEIFKENAVRNLLIEDFDQRIVDYLIPQDSEIKLGKSADRSVIGSMNDHWQRIPFYYDKFQYEITGSVLNQVLVNRELNRTPMQCSKKGFFPIEKLKELTRDVREE